MDLVNDLEWLYLQDLVKIHHGQQPFLGLRIIDDEESQKPGVKNIAQLNRMTSMSSISLDQFHLKRFQSHSFPGYLVVSPFTMTALVFHLIALLGLHCQAATSKTKNVFLITTDGLRWEEVFHGADRAMINKEFGNVSDTNRVETDFWRDTPSERRELLMPFIWRTVAAQGQIWGNRELKSDVRVSNTRHFSYPGYNEFLTGYADPAIDSNDKKLNLNTNVFEWLNLRTTYTNRVAAVINWDVLPWILNGPRSKIPIWSAFPTPPGTINLNTPDLLNSLAQDSKTIWSGVILDTFAHHAAIHAIKTLKPKALYVSYGETDDWAHDGAYERYLRSAKQFDHYLSELWNTVQSMSEYKGTTAFVISTDHGRGPGPVAWKNHGANISESAYMWFAVLGPDVPPLGERKDTPLATQGQIAATVAALLGEDFNTENPRASKPFEQIGIVR